MSTALAVRDGSVAMQVFGDDYAAIKSGIAANLTDTELDYLASVARSMGLSVLRKQIYGTKRKAKDANGNWTETLTIQVGIDGYRVIADRSGKYAGQIGPLWCGEDGAWRDVWLSKTPPAAAKVGVLRKDFHEPLWAVAVYESYVARNRDGSPNNLWNRMPELMLAKCAESLALRKAFPDEMAGTYTEEEMQQADNGPRAAEPTPLREVRPPSTPIVQERAAPLSAPRLKASVQPNGADETRRKLVELGNARGVPLTTEMDAEAMADLIDACLDALGIEVEVAQPVTARALHNALVALPPRAVDAETGEVTDTDDFSEVDRLVDAGLAAMAAAREE